MKFCKYCSIPEFCEELEELEAKKNKMFNTEILTRNKALKINGIPFGDIWVSIYGNELQLHIAGSHEIFDIIHFSSRKIKYCPMCGRKLKKERA